MLKLTRHRRTAITYRQDTSRAVHETDLRPTAFTTFSQSGPSAEWIGC
jgi:hypothetical protein